MLAGCGGGSSTDSPENPTPPNGNNQTTLNTLSISAKYKDSCGNETAAGDAALLVHNNDYSNKEIIYADSNGNITYETENANQTISIVMRGSDEINGVKPVFLATYVDHPVSDMGDYFHYSDSTEACQCQYFDLNVSVPARANDFGNGRISGVEDDGHINNNYGYTSFVGLESCKSATGEWPLVSPLITYSNPEQSFAALVSDISTTTDVNAEIAGVAVDITTNDFGASKQVSTVIDGDFHFRNYAFDQASNVYGYETDSVEHYSVSAYKFETIYEIPNVDDAFLWIASREYSTELNKSFDLPLPIMDYTTLFNILVSDSGQYDLSNTSNMDYLSIGIEASSNNYTMLDWYIYAPTSGQVPSIENMDFSAFVSDDILDASIDSIEMSVSARGYDGINGYQDFLNSRAEMTTDNLTNEKWSKSEFVYFEITTSNFDITNSTRAESNSKVNKASAQKKVANEIFNKLLNKERR